MPHDRLLPQPGEVWRHWKGGLYEVVCLAIDEALGRTMVVYAPVGPDEPVWVRTLFSWMHRFTGPSRGETGRDCMGNNRETCETCFP